MTYSLDLFFKPAIAASRISQYFLGRKYFCVADKEVSYENSDTQVSFSFQLRLGRNLLLRRTVVAMQFTLSYGCPSWFGDEAEIELSAFMAAFRPRIEDVQIRGMGDGPYSGRGFLAGWDFGNTLVIRRLFVDRPSFRMPTLPRARLRAAWAWNYGRAAKHDPDADRQFVPLIQFASIEGRVCTTTVWPYGMPISLPRVDYVLVGRRAGDEYCFGLASWADVVDVIAQDAQFDIEQDPIDLEYVRTPPAIAKWVANIALIDFPALERLPASQVFDAEIAKAAWDSIEHGEIDGAITLVPPPRAAA